MIQIKPEAEELVYSICARAAERLGYTSPRLFTEHVFGRSTVTAVQDLPTHLGRVAQTLTAGFGVGASDLIWRHTLLPLYAPFQPGDRVEVVAEAMAESSPVHLDLGLVAMRIPAPRWLRYCVKCIVDDVKSGRDPYWRRVHQVSFVQLCPDHGVRLQDSNVPVGITRTHRHSFVPLSTVPIRREVQAVDLSVPATVTLLHLAREATWLLHNAPPPFDPLVLRHTYLSLLSTMDLATSSGRVRARRLVPAFLERFGGNFLDEIGCGLSDAGEDNWLLRLLRAPRVAQHPLRHLLLMHFLGSTVADVLQSKPGGSATFGGPWPCLNPAAGHVEEELIAVGNLVEGLFGNAAVYEFGCPACGFTYRRRAGHDPRRYESVRHRGPVWESALRESWPDAGVSLRELSRRLGVDPKTAERHAQRLGLAVPRPRQRKEIEPRMLEQKAQGTSRVNLRLSQWAAAVTHAGGSVKLARQAVPAVFAALYRQNPLWVRSEQRLTRAVKSRRVDWAQRDAQLASQVEDAVHRVQGQTQPIQRVTMTSIARAMAALPIIQKKAKLLPTTMNVMNHHLETREAFAARRVRGVLEICELADEAVPLWVLLRRAGVRPDLAGSAEVQHVLEIRHQKNVKGANINDSRVGDCP